MLKPLSKYIFWLTTFLLLASNAQSAQQDDGWYVCNNIYEWSSSINFSTGNIVRDKGVAYKAKRQTRAELPNANSGSTGAWQKLGGCGVSSAISCDFNGDGILDYAKGHSFADLVSGKSNGEIPTTQTGLMNAGEVTIIYGNKPLNGPADQVWNQNSLGMFAYARKNAEFGWRTIAGDFNQDNFCDLAISAPGFSLDPNTQNKGTANILYGSPNGLTIHVADDNGQPVNPYDAQRFDQDSSGVPGAAETGDYFGRDLATGDINGDGFDDLIIGVPGEDTTLVPQLGPVVDAGYFHILYGSRRGIQTSQPGAVGYFQHITGVPLDEVKANEQYGLSVTSADFDHDGFSDLVISAPYESGGGKVSLFKGSSSGIDIASRRDLTLNNFPNPGSVRSSFGVSVYAYDFNNDGYIDLGIYYDHALPNNFVEAREIRILGSASCLVINP
jgi:hypothetical protein